MKSLPIGSWSVVQNPEGNKAREKVSEWVIRHDIFFVIGAIFSVKAIILIIAQASHNFSWNDRFFRFMLFGI